MYRFIEESVQHRAPIFSGRADPRQNVLDSVPSDPGGGFAIKRGWEIRRLLGNDKVGSRMLAANLRDLGR